MKLARSSHAAAQRANVLASSRKMSYTCCSHLWLCRGRVHQIAGVAGSGKTWLSLSLLASALSSLPKVQPAAEIWWVCSRSGVEAGVERLRAAGVEQSLLARLRVFVAVDANALAVVLRSALAESCDLPLLLLDSAADVLGPVCAGNRNFSGLVVVQSLARLLHGVARRVTGGGCAVIITNDVLPDFAGGGTGSSGDGSASAPAAAAAISAAAASRLSLMAGTPLPRQPRLALGPAWAAVPDATLVLHGPASAWQVSSRAERLPRLEKYTVLSPAIGAILPLFVTCLQPECQALAVAGIE